MSWQSTGRTAIRITPEESAVLDGLEEELIGCSRSRMASGLISLGLKEIKKNPGLFAAYLRESQRQRRQKRLAKQEAETKTDVPEEELAFFLKEAQKHPPVAREDIPAIIATLLLGQDQNDKK
ncbi:MAG: hypothetical protein ACYTEQ_12335 [Planctomycetota bacterium]|jgi:hypothetical protein